MLILRFIINCCETSIGNVLAVNELIAVDKQAVHVVDKDGATPLMFAAMRGHTEVGK